jgi:hypothetical protein
MKYLTLNPRAVARLSTAALWAVGSLYLMKNELANPSPDVLIMWSTPVVWAVILALPVLSTYARRDGQWVAMALLWIAAICGSAYTLQATLGRNAESRDIRIERARQVNEQRVSLMRELDTNRAMLAQAVAKCGSGRKCLPATEATIKVYQAAVLGTETKLSRLSVVVPDAGEQRIAWVAGNGFRACWYRFASIVRFRT